MTTMQLVSFSSLIVDNFSDKKLKKLYPDWKFISHFIRNTSDLKLKCCFLYAGHYCTSLKIFSKLGKITTLTCGVWEVFAFRIYFFPLWFGEDSSFVKSQGTLG